MAGTSVRGVRQLHHRTRFRSGQDGIYPYAAQERGSRAIRLPRSCIDGLGEQCSSQFRIGHWLITYRWPLTRTRTLSSRLRIRLASGCGVVAFAQRLGSSGGWRERKGREQRNQFIKLRHRDGPGSFDGRETMPKFELIQRSLIQISF